MAEKRRVSARLKQEVPSPKRQRKSHTVQPPEPEPQHDSPPPPEEPLPSSISEDHPLPTIRNYDSILDSEKLKSVAASGVLAASLQRSKTKWLTGGLFEKYWEKPSKRRDYKEPPNNPAKDSMSRVPGTARLIIEPHIFEVHLYTVRDPSGTQTTVENNSASSFVQYRAHTTNHTATPQSTQPAQASQQTLQPQELPRVTQSGQSSVPFTHHGAPTPTSNTTAAPPNNNYTPAPPSASTSTRPSAPAQAQTQPEAIAPSIPPQAPPPPPPPQAKSGQDPVIQMLAQRASTSPDLKMLMKIVASGQATRDQLRVFQSHIDDLNAILHHRNQAAAAAAANRPAPAYQHAPPPSPRSSAPAPANTNPHLPPAPYNPIAAHAPGPTSSQPRQSSASSHAGMQPPSYATPPPFKSKMYTPKPDISVVAMEFTAGSGDRYRFPRNSILEYLPQQRQIIASFLVVRKGSEAAAPPSGKQKKYPKKADFYEPITIRIVSDQHKALDALLRCVAPSSEVVAYMQECMSKMTRTPRSFLALQLPHPAPEDAAGSVAGEAVEEEVQKPKKWARNKHQHEDLDLRCQMCFKALPRDVSASTNNVVMEWDAEAGVEVRVCATCAGLRRQSAAAGKEHGAARIAASRVLPNRSAVQSLLLAPEVSLTA